MIKRSEPGKKKHFVSSLKPALIGDFDLLLEWRNEPETRKNSFHQDIVDRETHGKWLEGVLKDPNRELFILQNEAHTPIGQIRFDIEEGRAEVNVSIGKEFRGMGYGSDAVQYGTERFLSEHTAVGRVLARVKEENIGSLKAFARAGYRELSREGGIVSLVFERKE